jgi:hypothetical protein
MNLRQDTRLPAKAEEKSASQRECSSAGLLIVKARLKENDFDEGKSR